MMQLEELQRQWQSVEEKLDRTMAIEGELLRQTVLKTTRSRVNRLAIWPTLDIAFCLVIVVFSGAFLGDHWDVWALAAPACIVVVAAIVLLIDSTRRLVHVATINWSGTVVEIQASLSQFRAAKIRQFKWIILFSPLVGFSCLITSLQWMLDRLPQPQLILEKVDPLWVTANFIFGALFVPFGYLAIRFFATRFQTRGWFQRILDDISGSSVRKAEREVERWISLTDAGSQEAE
jgi:hypothetical protein